MTIRVQSWGLGQRESSGGGSTVRRDFQELPHDVVADLKAQYGFDAIATAKSQLQVVMTEGCKRLGIACAYVVFPLSFQICKTLSIIPKLCAKAFNPLISLLLLCLDQLFLG